MAIINQKINGIEYDFSTIKVIANSLELKGIQSINFTGNQDHLIVQGAGTLPLGATPGTFSGTGTMEMILSDFKEFYTSFENMMHTYFAVNMSYDIGGLNKVTEDLPKCLVTSFGSNNAVASVLTRTVEFQLLVPPKIDKRSISSDDSDLLGKAFRFANVLGGAGDLVKGLF